MPEMEKFNSEIGGKIIIAQKQAGELEKFVEKKQAKRRIDDYIRQFDETEKALTGRTPEIIAKETGFGKEEIFPENEQILYVGDPWQRMGREINDSRLKIIDYEFGETASFISNEEYFRNDICLQGEYLLTSIESAINSIKKDQNTDKEKLDISELEELKKLVGSAWEMSKDESLDFYENFYDNDDYGGNGREEKKKKLDGDYKKIAEAWKEARIFIEKKHNQDKTLKDEAEVEQEEKAEKIKIEDFDVLEILYKEAWYKCVNGERGFRDIPDWHNIIIPKLERILEKAEGEKGMSLTEEEKDDLVGKYRKKFIDDIRLKKRTDEAEVLQARFPELPFKDKSFGRFVASWSISAHIFDWMNKREFDCCWEEIARVLAKDGEAYIFPLNYHFGDKTEMLESLKEAAVKLNFTWEIYDYNKEAMSESDVENYQERAYTLKIKMK